MSPPDLGTAYVGSRIGVDVGGTFTDLICVTPDGRVLLDKTPTTVEDQSLAVMTGLGQLAERFGVDLATFCAGIDTVVHGTTTADNTMIEQDGAAVGLLVTEGHRDEIEMRRVHKEQIWDPAYPAPFPIARRRCRIPIPERVDYQGDVLLPLDEDAVRAGIRRLRQLGAESFAVMFLFSFVNPDHERRARELIVEEYPEVGHISLSHEVMPRGPEFERTSTTLVNAYVAPRVSSYVQGLGRRLRDAGYGGELLIMASTGGVMPPATVDRRAVALLGSGPTGGVMGAAAAAAGAAMSDFVAVDMGGTSFDICLVRDGEPDISTDWNWRYRYYIGMPMVDVQCVGAGGGSIARVRQGSLLVGPESAGFASRPGLLRAGRHRRHGDRRRRRARLRAPRRVRRWSHDPGPGRGRGGGARRCGRSAGHRRRRSRLGDRTDRERQHGQRHPAGAGRLGRRSPRPRPHRLRRQRAGARLGDRRRAGPGPDPRAQGGAGVQRPRPAGVGLQGRPDPQLRHPAVARSTSTTCTGCWTSSTPRSPTSWPRPASAPTPSPASATCRWPTPGRTST